MGRQLAMVAQELGCSERTMRRYTHAGMLRARTIAPGRREIPDDERRYATAHWEVLSRLRGALRTERDVRLAVLFGSAAVGDDRADSDVDVLVARRSTSAGARASLSLRLQKAVGRQVHLVDVDQAETSAALLADVVREGRPLLDRDDLWAGLLGRREEILHDAAREDRALIDGARDAVLDARARLA